MLCPACGAEVVEQAVFCHKCGERLDASGGACANNARPADDSSAGGTGPSVTFRPNGKDQPEETIWQGGYSAKAMVTFWAGAGLASIVFLVVGILWARTAWLWLTLVALIVLPWAYGLLVLCYRRFSVRYTLTTQRFIHETGILRHVNNRIEVLDMDDITFEQGLLERLFGVGTIRIASHDRTDPELVLPGIENVADVAAKLDNARLAERRRRGLHVEQI